MEFSTWLNWIAVALQIFAPGALMIWPDQKWIGFGCMFIGLAIALTSGALFLSGKEIFVSLKRFWFLVPTGMFLGIMFVWVFSLFPAFQSSDISFASSWQRWESLRKDLKLVEQKSFVNQEVPLDGYFYNNCTFENVTFFFEGKAPFKMANSTMTKPFVDPRNPALNDMMYFLKELKLLDTTRVRFLPPPTN